MTPDWKALRAEFPALANWTYLNYGYLWPDAAVCRGCDEPPPGTA